MESALTPEQKMVRLAAYCITTGCNTNEEVADEMRRIIGTQLDDAEALTTVSMVMGYRSHPNMEEFLREQVQRMTPQLEAAELAQAYLLKHHALQTSEALLKRMDMLLKTIQLNADTGSKQRQNIAKELTAAASVLKAIGVSAGLGTIRRDTAVRRGMDSAITLRSRQAELSESTFALRQAVSDKNTALKELEAGIKLLGLRKDADSVKLLQLQHEVSTEILQGRDPGESMARHVEEMWGEEGKNILDSLSAVMHTPGAKPLEITVAGV